MTTRQSGFAPAVSPPTSTTVHTPDNAIIAGVTSIPSQGDDMPAYHARPKQTDGLLPVVIVVQEILVFMSTFVTFAVVWLWKGIWLSHQNSIFAKAIPMTLPISLRCLVALSPKCLTLRYWPIWTTSLAGPPATEEMRTS